MRLECHEDVGDFDVLQTEWNVLLQRSATDTLFLTWEWQRAWWEAFRAGKRLRLITMRDDGGHLNAIVPLFVQDTVLDPGALLPGINVENPLVVVNGGSKRTAHLVGGSEVSDYLDIIAPAELNHQACGAFLDFLATREDWQILDLRSLPSASPTVSTVTELARAHGWDVQQVKEDVCPILELPGTWEEYLATKLNKKQRHELRRKMRKAERETNVHWYWADAPHDISSRRGRGQAHSLEEGLEIFFELHRASHPDKDAFMDAQMEDFFRAVTQAACNKGWLRLSVMRFDGQAVASYLCFDYGGDRLVYNSGFDLSTYGYLSPGIVLLGHLISDAIERGCHRFDFLQGDERYKYDLGATDTEVLRLFIRR